MKDPKQVQFLIPRDDKRICVQPPKKEPPPLMISDRVEGLRTDAEVRRFVNNATRKDEVAVIEFGASWCHHCHQVFPAFYALTKQVHIFALHKSLISHY